MSSGATLRSFAPNKRFSPNHYKFSGKDRDAASGLDDFGARYYSAVMGRFMTPDWSASPEPVPYAKLDNPQSLNLYSYVQNNPLTGIDADGHCGNGLVGNELTPGGPKPKKDPCPSVAKTKVAAKQATVPSTLPPLAFPSLQGASKLLGGFLDIVGDVLEDVAVPLVFLANPASTASEAQDTIQHRRPTADVRRKADQAATDAEGNLHCSYCGQVLTPEAGKTNSREYDHVTPHSQGGDRTIGNIKDACRSCNRQKGPRTPEQWGGPLP